MNICVLQLENNKCFVGTTNYLYEQEVLKDFNKRTSMPIVKVIKVFPIHYFGTTKEEKAIEQHYEVKKITQVMISRHSKYNVTNELQETYPIKTIIKKNFTTETDWYEEFDRQQSSSSMGMFSSPCCGELYNESNLNLEWSKKMEEEPKSPFEMFYESKHYDIEDNMLKSSYL
jgi:hypothetical protein